MFSFVTVTKVAYPLIAGDFSVSTCFGFKLMTTRMMPSRKALARYSVEGPPRIL